MTWIVQLAGSHNICSPTSWRSPRGLDAIVCGTAIVSSGILCICHTFGHVAFLDVAIMLFGCPMFTSLCRLCNHDYTFSSPRNRYFGYRVLCLEGGRFDFLESRPLTRCGPVYWIAMGGWQAQTWTVGWGVEELLPHSIDVPHMLQRLTGSEYLYPLVPSFHLRSTSNFLVFTHVCLFFDFPIKFTQSLFFTTPPRLFRKKWSSLVG